MEKVLLVAVNYPGENSVLAYLDNPELGNLGPGSLVEVPLGRRLEKGLVIQTDVPPEEIKRFKGKEHSPKKIQLKKIHRLLGDGMTLGEVDLQLFKWTSTYYHYNLGKLVFDCLPPLDGRIKPPAGIKGMGQDFEFELNASQRETVKGILQEISREGSSGFHRFLVHGITGSGKTAIYLELIKKVIGEGKSVLFLLPEINLTPQFLKTFETYLGATIFPYHSGVKKGEKAFMWKMVQEERDPLVVVGTRSSIFLPLKNLGLILVDEEHDPSFKQEDRCPYNARDLAVKKAQLLQIPVVLGSATPSLESYWFHHKGPPSPPHYFPLKARIGGAILPRIEIISDRSSPEKEKYREEEWPLSPRSMDEIRGALQSGEQVLVFINRLGFAHYIQCKICGHRFACVNCTSNLRFFKNRGRLSCQFCDFSIPMPEACLKCGCLNLEQKGYGTEKILEVLEKAFPQYRTERFDRDEIKSVKDLSAKLGRFHAQEIDILVGTQMLSKGHNFRKVNLVVILGIDFLLNFPDFRSNEKVFQLLAQVAGRSGRFGEKGRVLIQTMNPENEVFEYLRKEEFWQFYQNEIEMRRLFNHPPFQKIIVIYIISKSVDKGLKTGQELKKIMARLSREHFPSLFVSDVKPTFAEKRVNHYSWCVMLRGPEVNHLHNALHSLKRHLSPEKGVQIKIDVDPYHFQ